MLFPLTILILNLKTYNEASKHASWQSAMQDELQALAANNTWQLTPLPPERKLLVVNGYIKSNTILMALLSATKLELLPKGSPNMKDLIS